MMPGDNGLPWARHIPFGLTSQREIKVLLEAER
jgi:hypothetical protein